MNASITPNSRRLYIVLCIVFNKQRTACMMNVWDYAEILPSSDQSSGTDAKEVQEKHDVEDSDCLQPK